MCKRLFDSKRGPVGRGDLDLLLRKFPTVPSEVVGQLLGYDYCPRQSEKTKGGLKGEVSIEGGHKTSSQHQKKLHAPLFWGVVSRQSLTRDTDTVRQSQQIDLGRGELPDLKPIHSKPLPFVPIRPWTELWPCLKSVLQGSILSKSPDEKRIAQQLARDGFISEIQKKKRKAWANYSQIIIDVPLRLFCFWKDFNYIVNNLSELIPASGLVKHYIKHSPLYDAFDINTLRYYPHTMIPDDGPILILSDLGVYGSPQDRDQWCQFGRQLQRSGHHPVVLTPVPKRLWDERHADLFGMICWDGRVGFSNFLGGDGEESACLPLPVETLLTLCSSALRVEPYLLRAIRRLIPGADIGVEGEAWNHKDVDSTYLSFSFKKGKAKKYQNKFKFEYEKAKIENAGGLRLFESAIQTINQHHCGHSSELQLEEQFTQFALRYSSKDGDNQIPEHLAHYLGWLDAGAKTNKASSEAVEAWIRRMGYRQECLVMEKVPGISSMRKAVATAFKDAPDDTLLPDFISEDDIKQAQGKEPVNIQKWTAIQRGDELVFDKADNLVGTDVPGASLFPIAAQERISLQRGDDLTFSSSLTPGFSFTLKEGGRLQCKTSQELVTLAPITKPEWAEAIWRDGLGLHATLLYGKYCKTQSEIQWVLPQSSGLAQLLPSSIHFKDDTIELGFWINQTQAKRLHDEGVPDISWAASHGTDQYGLWAAFQIRGITQRMRWIHPGTFLMGSPRSELERSDNELQHEVTLSKGFWLADTTCTQELWEAVTGGDPSFLKGELQRPVDSVSWDDCQDFLQKVNSQYPSLGLALPTEAQWEYACRAGTETPFSFGENITTDLVNFDGRNPYKNGEKGEERNQTVPVKGLPCNQWGLYQMHGNVWEWCADWYGSYPETSLFDPIGPEDGGLRVLRGGSWIGDGGHVRSASRFWDVPGGRNRSIGFRFSRGQ
ncbi:formylglycine-generating enzyme family protein [Pseudodesulfovibrio sp.]|uniref:formylglycine-generating enzyme family protein n=1 Tax=unclassified Pseudodesulfovibrio TaxID=2661612 RepID=UPI003B00E812